MMIACNRKNLKKHAKDLLGVEYSPEKEAELIKECLAGFKRYISRHIYFDQIEHLERIDKILENFGVEGGLFDKEGNTMSLDRVVIDLNYSNTGDSYGLTILYVNGKLKIGYWASLFE